MISASQCRAARALLNWSQPDLAKRCSVHVQTISNFESETSTPNKTTLDKLEQTFEAGGVLFTEDEGVKKNKNVVAVLEGPDANEQFLNNLFHDLKGRKGEEILLTGVRQIHPDRTQERQFIENHIERLQEEGLRERVILREGDYDFIGPASWYRWIPEKYFTYAPFQQYGDKLVLKNLEENQTLYIIENPLFAKAFKNIFDFVWDHCKVPPPRK